MFKSGSFISKLSATAAAAALLATVVAAAPQTDFSLRAVDGQTVTAAGLRGKVVVLAVGALWLPLSREQVQGVQKLANDYAGRDVEVFWVSADSDSQGSKNYASDEQVRAFAGKYGLKVRVLRDPEGRTAKQLGADQLPALIVFDKQGKVAGGPINGFDPQGDLTEKLKSVLAPLL